MKDYIVRATAANNQIRAFAATTRDVVETARAAHGTSPVATAALGRLLTAGAMMGSMMKNEKDMLNLYATEQQKHIIRMVISFFIMLLYYFFLTCDVFVYDGFLILFQTVDF